MAVSRLTQTSLQNAFQKYNSIWDGKTAVGSMDEISSITLTGTQASVAFNSIPSTYTHLQLRISGTVSSGAYHKINFNSDNTGSNYFSHSIWGGSTSGGASNLAGTSYPQIVVGGGYSVTANNVFGIIIDIADYTNTSKTKILKALYGFDTNSIGGVELDSGIWNSTTAITSIIIAPSSGSYNSNSVFSLYGIK